MVLVESYLTGNRATFYCEGDNIWKIQNYIEQKEGVSKEDFYLIYDELHFKQLFRDTVFKALPRIRGGKGGFGSMLRAIGAQIEKTTNREACRDLSGRRLRDINEEKRLKDFIAKRAEREREALERKKKKLKNLLETPKHIFEDKTYFEQREQREKDIFESLDKAFSSSKPGTSSKRRCEEAPAKPKKGRFLDDLDESSEESSDEHSTRKAVQDTSENSNSEEAGESNQQISETCSNNFAINVVNEKEAVNGKYKTEEICELTGEKSENFSQKSQTNEIEKSNDNT